VTLKNTSHLTPNRNKFKIKKEDSTNTPDYNENDIEMEPESENIMSQDSCYGNYSRIVFCT